MEQIIFSTLLLLGLGLAFGLILGIADKFLYVKPDERMATFRSMLPGINCGACGQPGCDGLTAAVFDYKGKITDCRPMKPDQREKIKEWIKTAEGPDGTTLDLSKIT